MGRIGRLFYEIGGDTKRLEADLQRSVDLVKDSGVKISRQGTSFLAAFDQALNPTKALGEELRLLERAGKSSGDIMAVHGDKIRAATQAAREHGQAIPDIVSKYAGLGAASGTAGVSIEGLGRVLGDFARNPLQAAQAGIGSLVATLGPTAVGIAGIAAAIGLAAAAFLKFASSAAESAEQAENLSTITGMSVQRLQALQQVAREAGLEGIDLGRIIGKLNSELGKEAESEFEAALRTFNISVRDGNGTIKDAVLLLDELRSSLMAIENPAQRAQLANAAIGGRLREVIPLVLSARGSIGELSQALIDQGFVLDDLSHKRLLAFDAKLDAMTRTIAGAKNELAGFAASVTSFAEETAKAYPRLNAFAMALAQAVGGKAGLDLYIALTDQAAEKTRELSDAEKDAWNYMVRMGGTIEQVGKATRATAEAKEASHKIDEPLLSDAETWRRIIDAAAGSWRHITTEIGAAKQAQGALLAELGKLAPRGAAAPMAGKSQAQIDDDLLKPTMAGTEKLQKEMQSAAKKVSAEWGQQISTIVTDWSRGIADMITSGKSFGEQLANIFRQTANSIIRMLLEVLFRPFQQWLSRTIGGNAPATATAGAGSIYSIGSTLGAGGYTAGGSFATTPKGSLAMAGLMTGGSMLASDAWRRGSGLEGAIGGGAMGAAAGMMLGTQIGAFAGPIGIAIGAGIGALIGGITTGIFGGGERARQKEAARRLGIQEQYMTDIPGSISRVGAFGSSGDYDVESDLTGRMRASRRQPVQVVVKIEALDVEDFERRTGYLGRVIGKAIMGGGGQIGDDIGWAAGGA